MVVSQWYTWPTSTLSTTMFSPKLEDSSLIDKPSSERSDKDGDVDHLMHVQQLILLWQVSPHVIMVRRMDLDRALIT